MSLAAWIVVGVSASCTAKRPTGADEANADDSSEAGRAGEASGGAVGGRPAGSGASDPPSRDALAQPDASSFEPQADAGLAPDGRLTDGAWPLPSGTFVRWVWSGAVTPQSARVVAKLAGSAAPVLRVSEQDNLQVAWTYAGQVTTVGSDLIAQFQLRDLKPKTIYHYAVQRPGALDVQRGRFETPAMGAFSFKFVAMACADTGSNDAVFDAIANEKALFAVHAGDFHYEDPGASDDPALFQRLFDQVLTAPKQANLFRSLPVAYIWDDHDVGLSPAGRLAYQLHVPHHPLAEGTGAAAIPYHAFTVGRARFILTDLRSRQGSRDDKNVRSMMGTQQKAWFKQQLLQAKEQNKVVFWINSAPWIGAASPGTDRWWSYAEERQEISQFIATQNIKHLISINGDAHMLAYDDGQNTNYASGESGGFPLFHVAALARPGSVKGGPFSGGAIPGAGQYAAIQVNDTGQSQVQVIVEGKRRGEVRLRQELSIVSP